MSKQAVDGHPESDLVAGTKIPALLHSREPASGITLESWTAIVVDCNDGPPIELLFKASRRNASLPQIPAGREVWGNLSILILNVCPPQGKRFFADSSVFLPGETDGLAKSQEP